MIYVLLAYHLIYRYNKLFFHFCLGCMNDIRYNGAWFPMDKSQNQESNSAVMARSDNLQDGCATLECATLNCLPPLTCYDMWRYAECRCPAGQRLVRGDSDGVCENINECVSNPCIHGYCKDLPGSFVCSCYPGYTGELCSAETRAVGVVLFSTGAILGIIISALALLCKYINHKLASIQDIFDRFLTL